MRPRPPLAASLLVLIPFAQMAAVELGWEDFSYPNGLILGATGGTGFNYDLFDGEVTATTSDWDNVQGAPVVSGNTLVTNNSSALREYNGNIEAIGGPANDGQDNHERSGAIRGTGQVFFRVRITRSSSAVWSGVSSYDFDTERLFFGVPGTGAATDTIGIGEDGVGTTLGSLTLTDGQSYDLLAVVDFDNNLTGLFVDPDSSDFWDAGGGSADVTRPYFGTNWSTAVRLGSGGQTTWDKLRVVTDWSDLTLVDDDTDNDGMSDAWEAANGLVVGVDDGGLDPDGDGLNNRDEYGAGSDPQVADSDGDGFGDGAEVIAGSNSLAAASFPGAVPPAGLIGFELFDYPVGSVGGLDGGGYWDVDNSTANDPFLGHTARPSAWAVVGGDPQVGGGVLRTRNGSAVRPYAVPEAAGAIGGAAELEAQVVYYRFEMTRRPGASWGGASSYENGAERFLFGVPNAVNPGSGQREFAIHDLTLNAHAYSGIQPDENRSYTLVARLDYVTNEARLYLDPELSLPESGQAPVASYTHTGNHRSSAIRFGSGGSGDVEWDVLRVATSWEALREVPPSAVDDSCTLAHLGSVRIPVLRNDSGDLHSPSLTILSGPASGTATANPDGTISYTHTGGTPATDSITYEVSTITGALADTGTVTINFTAAPRFDTAYAELPPEPPATALQVVDAFPGLTFDSPHDFCTVPGDPGKLFITEGDGRVFLIPDVAAAAPEKVQVLDITDRINHDDNELALKGIAAHPDWATNGHLYLTYNSSAGTVRLSRFTCQTTPPYTAGAELVLIDQANDGVFHSISTCAFGADGYLYVGFGDEGSQSDAFDNSQHIDKDLWSCLIRIDVDKRPGNLEPNPDPDIPRDGGGLARFSVPADNPFVGATSFNGVAVDPGEVRTEIFVTGLRNPWQFSPEDLDGDGTVDEIWVGDVGRADREEIGVYTAGQNGGWAWREGSLPGVRSGQPVNGAPEAAASLTAPLHDYGHGGGAFEGQSVTGGLIYRGDGIPQLTGKYIFADYVSGHIWSLERTGPAPTVERLGGEVAIVAIGTDPSNGDLLLLDRGNTGYSQGVGGIKRLNLGGGGNDAFPRTLSQTNFFADLATLAPNPGGVAYTPNLRFWSDFAEKSRWFLLNNTTDTVGYAPEGPWSYPEGMVWVKHFDYPAEWESFTRTIDGVGVPDRRPAAGSPRRRVETRFLVRTTQGAYGVSYRWNNLNGGSQIDAALADNNGERFEIGITLDGAPATVPWEIPSRSSCLTCHTPEAGHALSFNTRQLNAPGVLGGAGGNFLELLSSAGYATGIPAGTEALPRHLRPDEDNYSLEARVRSYLEVNCAYCHQAGGTGGGSWDGRSDLTLAQTGLVNGAPSDAPLHPADLLVVPGNVDRSILYNRAAGANGYSRMPPLATEVVDLEGAQLLADWIREEVQPHASYDDWRLAHFGSLVSPEGQPDANPDADSADNRYEWLTNTDPNDPASLWEPVLRTGDSTVALDLPGLGNRAVTVLHSTDLQSWNPWSVPGNDGLPLNPDRLHTLEGPRSDPEGFFRFEIRER